MGKIADKLRRLLNIKAAIKEALFYVGQEVADKFEDYAAAIRNVCSVPFENLGYSKDFADLYREAIKNAYKFSAELKRKEEAGQYVTSAVNSYLNELAKEKTNFIFAPKINGKTYGSQLILGILALPNNIKVNADTAVVDRYFRYSSALVYDVEFVSKSEFSANETFAGCHNAIIISFNAENISSLNKTFFSAIRSMDRLRVISIVGLGTNEKCTSIDFGLCENLGIDSDIIKNAKQKLMDTLLTNSFDRASAGYSVFTITLRQNTFNLLTEEEIEAITNKGYTITV
jgi:hypothetical protein